MKKENLSKIAAKNSIYSLSFGMINKIGGLIFTIILARLLLPELFGIYSLVISIIVIVLVFIDIGINNTGVRYMSDALVKRNKKKARSFFRYILKIKGIMTLIAIIIVLIMAKPLSVVFNKPLIYIPLLFSCFYIATESLRSLFTIPFNAKKDIKILIPAELIFQTSKIILAFIAISLLSYELKIPGIFFALAISGLLFFSLEFLFLMRTDKNIVFGKLSKIDYKKILKYMGFMGITSITLVFFGSVDTLMLGRFVDAEYLGFYRAALTLVVSIASFLPFSGVLLPIFTQIHGKRLYRGFEKSLRYLIILAIPMSVGLMFISKHLISAIYGKEYMIASSSLLILSPLVIISPLIALHSTIFQAKEKPKLLAKFMIVSLIINIIINYILIKILLTISQEYALLGAGMATLISNIFLLIVLTHKTKSQLKIKIEKKVIIKPIFAAGIMALFLLIFNKLVDINLFFGIMEIFFGALIYFGALFLMKGINKEDIILIKDLFKKKNN